MPLSKAKRIGTTRETTPNDQVHTPRTTRYPPLMPSKRLLIQVVLSAVAWYLWHGPLEAPFAEDLGSVLESPRSFDASLSIEREPIQVELENSTPLRIGDHQLRLRAEFQVEAHVLGRRDYRRGHEANFSPIDLALGWGPMARDGILEHIDIRQSGRFYFWRSDNPPIPLDAINRNSSNMHLIPAGDHILQDLKRIGEGDRVRLQGYLVDIERDNGWRWNTSLSRTDTGHGACELFIVTRALVLP